MKAVALTRHLPITDPASLVDVTLPDPVPAGHDLLVRVGAVSVNPVVHQQCIDCHREYGAGPVDCAQCHVMQ